MRRMLDPWPLAPACLAVAATLYLGYHFLVLGLDRRDAGLYETVLARATAGQLEHGPGALYGPYTGANPSVLMHAPLYYRLVGLGAWLPVRLGADPLTATLATGRLLTVLSTLALLVGAWALARLDGASRRSGLAAAALVGSCPILGVLSIMLRADALGVALATWGVVGVLRVIHAPDSGRSGSILAAAYTAFALAIAAKQQNLIVPALSTAFLALAWARGRLPATPIAAGLAAGLVVGGAVLGFEEVATGGLMRHAVFELPGGAFRAINYAGWDHTREILGICAKRSAGLLALGLAGTWALRRTGLPRRLDAILATYLAAEAVALVPLCLYNKGSADNYALQAVVFAAVLVGRLVDRALSAPAAPVLGRLAVGLASALVLANAVRLIGYAEHFRGLDRAAIAAVLEDPAVAACDSDERYFVGNQVNNRLHGRRALIHDEWLYGAFEAIREAEPRSGWLREALTTGAVRQVVVPQGGPRVPGVPEPLPELGYTRGAEHGDYTVWVRR